MNLLERLRRNRVADFLVKHSGIIPLLDAWLLRHPLKRRTPNGFCYRIHDLAGWVAANEVFTVGAYREAVKVLRPETFIDLGANSGYFPVLIADIMNSRQVKGLCVEPNPALAEILRAHLDSNSLRNVTFLQGAVSGEREAREVDFFVSPSHIASSLTGRFNPGVSSPGKTRRIQVPLLNLPLEWETRFPGKAVDLLKLDIEGMEIPFISGHADFLHRVKGILIEWHSWVAQFDEVETALKAAGMELHSRFEEDRHAGSALFRRVIL